MRLLGTVLGVALVGPSPLRAQYNGTEAWVRRGYVTMCGGEGVLNAGRSAASCTYGDLGGSAQAWVDGDGMHAISTVTGSYSQAADDAYPFAMGFVGADAYVHDVLHVSGASPSQLIFYVSVAGSMLAAGSPVGTDNSWSTVASAQAALTGHFTDGAGHDTQFSAMEWHNNVSGHDVYSEQSTQTLFGSMASGYAILDYGGGDVSLDLVFSAYAELQADLNNANVSGVASSEFDHTAKLVSIDALDANGNSLASSIQITSDLGRTYQLGAPGAVVATPEPTSASLLLAGFLSMAGIGYRRRQSRRAHEPRD